MAIYIGRPIPRYPRTATATPFERPRVPPQALNEEIEEEDKQNQEDDRAEGDANARSMDLENVKSR